MHSMAHLRLLSSAEQVAAHLREELINRVWTGMMPGGERLAGELGVGTNTVEAALRLLEKEGVLVSQGRRRGRRIELPEKLAKPSLRVAILLHDPSDRHLHYIVDLQHRLVESGHTSLMDDKKSLTELGMDVKKVARYVQQTEADAWVIIAGSREVLQWFADQPVPAFALFGRQRRSPLASIGTDKIPAQSAVVRRLVELGHRRIVMLVSEERRKPKPGLVEQAFLDELEAQGIESGSYNLPDWKGDQEGFYRCLDSLFQHTPPTALIIDQVPRFIAAQQYLARRGILAPEHVSLVCPDPDPAFDWCRPSIAHIRFDARPLVRRMVRWADNVSQGNEDRRKSLIPAEFIEGGTVGRAALKCRIVNSE
jgi:DNA-binding LacI/PurR family transcriptional regulator/biotin operon repressor